MLAFGGTGPASVVVACPPGQILVVWGPVIRARASSSPPVHATRKRFSQLMGSAASCAGADGPLAADAPAPAGTDGAEPGAAGGSPGPGSGARVGSGPTAVAGSGAPPMDGWGEKGRCPRALLRPRLPRGPAAAWDGIAPVETPSVGSGMDPGDSCAPPALSGSAPPGVLALPSGCSVPSAPSFPRARKPGPGAGVPPSW